MSIKKMEIFKAVHSAFVMALMLALSFGGGAAMAGVTTTQALRFGEFIVKNNDAVYTITVNTDGSYTYDAAGFIEITATAQPGIYTLDGLPPLTIISSVTISQITPLSGGGGENFQMTNFQENHPFTTTIGGTAEITVGGDAQTSGNGNPYLDQTYNGQLQIQINF